MSLAPRARFELATLRLTAEKIKNLSALSGVAYKNMGAIFPSLVAPKPAPKDPRPPRGEHRRGYLHSLSQTDSPLDFLKAGIVAQIVEVGPHFDQNQVGLAIVTRPL
jgi:hypothetical protein